MNSRKGFTLVEVIVILVVLSILAAMAVPVALRIFERTAEDTTREEMNNLKKALLGDPQKLQTSFRNDFGFLGDIGCLPTTAFPAAPALDRLSTQGTYPGWTFDSAKQAGAGWKGPYITGAPGEEFTKDQLGNSYVYTPAGGACPLTATLASNGPDGLPSTADDITVTIVANETTATIRGTVKNTSGTALAGVPVELYYPSNGTLTTSSPATTDASGNYSFTSAPFGARAVNANPRLVLVPNSVSVGGAGNAFVTFNVANYSSSSITIDNILVNCTALTNGGTRYDEITLDGANITPGPANIICNPAAAPPGRDVTDSTFTANSTPPSAMRAVVDSVDTQLPDLVLRGGTVRVIQIGRFENPGGAVAMGAQTFTVAFYDTAAVLISTVTVVTP